MNLETNWAVFAAQLVLSLLTAGEIFSQPPPRRTPPLAISLGMNITSHEITGGYGFSIGVRKNSIEGHLGAEIYNYKYGFSLNGRHYLPSMACRFWPFIMLRASYYNDRLSLGGDPSMSYNLHPGLGLKVAIVKNFSAQCQLGIGYSGFFRPNGNPIFTPAWIPTRLLHLGMCYDIPVRPKALEEITKDPHAALPNSGKFSFLLHTGLQINYLAPPSFERFTAGLGYDVHPKLAVTLRHQAVRTSDGLKYGKSLAGVRWMPGIGTHLRWVGSLEVGHWGSVLNFQAPIGAIGIMAGQHLQYRVVPGVDVELGLQYALLKAPRPLQSASSDFETSIGLLFRPWGIKL